MNLFWSYFLPLCPAEEGNVGAVWWVPAIQSNPSQMFFHSKCYEKYYLVILSTLMGKLMNHYPFLAICLLLSPLCWQKPLSMNVYFLCIKEILTSYCCCFFFCTKSFYTAVLITTAWRNISNSSLQPLFFSSAACYSFRVVVCFSGFFFSSLEF